LQQFSGTTWLGSESCRFRLKLYASSPKHNDRTWTWNNLSSSGGLQFMLGLAFYRRLTNISSLDVHSCAEKLATVRSFKLIPAW